MHLTKLTLFGQSGQVDYLMFLEEWLERLDVLILECYHHWNRLGSLYSQFNELLSPIFHLFYQNIRMLSYLYCSRVLHLWKPDFLCRKAMLKNFSLLFALGSSTDPDDTGEDVDGADSRHHMIWRNVFEKELVILINNENDILRLD